MEKRIDNRPTKEIFPNSLAAIDYAFTIKGVDYFCFNDFNNMSSDRAFNTSAFYQEMKSNCDRDYLVTFQKALDDIINDNKGIKITDIAILSRQLKERLEWIGLANTAYKLCSVVYFDASENPNRFEFKKGIEKAAIFEKEKMADFFLQKPIKTLLPHLTSLANDLPEYLEATQAINKKHIEVISTMLSEASKRSESYSNLVLQTAKELV